MLDSGAFTAWSKGEEVVLPELIEVYSRLIDVIGDIEKVWLINLDKIPGSPGVTASPSEIEDAIRISDDNYRVLEERFGNRIVPVFHQNEDEERLAEVCRMGAYICVSPRNDLGERHRRTWAKEVHGKIPKGVRTHGLATTGYPMMTTVPWHSVDSATWIMIAAYGHIYATPELYIVSISDDSPNRHLAGKHYINLTEPEREAVDRRMKEWGFTWDGLRADFVERATWNRLMMSELYRGIEYENLVEPIGLFDL